MKNFNRKAKFCKRIWENEMKYGKYIFSSYLKTILGVQYEKDLFWVYVDVSIYDWWLY